LEIVEIQERSEQGATKPFICKGADGQVYFVKGRSASTAERIREWMGANLAKAFGLNIPPFAIAEIHRSLVQLYAGDALTELGSGSAFASLSIPLATELKYEVIERVPVSVQRDILLFDQIARQTSPFRAGRIARVAKPPYVRSD